MEILKDKEEKGGNSEKLDGTELDTEMCCKRIGPPLEAIER